VLAVIMTNINQEAGYDMLTNRQSPSSFILGWIRHQSNYKLYDLLADEM